MEMLWVRISTNGNHFFQAYPLMSADKPYRCVSPVSATQIHDKNWTSDVTHDQCNVNVTDLHTGKLALVPCTAWEFEDDGRFTLKVRPFP